MKISFISSHAISQAMRYQTLRMQADLAKANQEMQTLRLADPGLVLGARTGYSVSLSRESERLKSLIDSNQLASSRLAATQLNLQRLTTIAEDLTAVLTTARDSTVDPDIPRREAAAALKTAMSALNVNMNGQHLFAGINTDVTPINDFSDLASPNRVAFDQAFQTYFGFTQTDPAAANITAAQIEGFLTTQIEPQFLGAGWTTLWSSATDEQITSRITLTETAETSVSANIPGVRKLMMAAASVANLLQAPLNGDASKALMTRAIGLLGEATVDLVNQQSYTGITEERLKNASERLEMQRNLFATTISDMEGVDPYEASSRVDLLMTQLEISYSLTARMQNLSLVRFLS